jgi:hypothetical protein
MTMSLSERLNLYDANFVKGGDGTHYFMIQVDGNNIFVIDNYPDLEQP